MRQKRTSSSRGCIWETLYPVLAAVIFFILLPKLTALTPREHKANRSAQLPDDSHSVPLTQSISVASTTVPSPIVTLSLQTASTLDKATPTVMAVDPLPPTKAQTPAADATGVVIPTLSIIDPATDANPSPPTALQTPAPTATTLLSPTLPATNRLQEQLLQLANQLRATEACPLLSPDPQLYQAAQRHAEDLARHKLISHVGSDGATLQDRLRRVGYPFQLSGENIAAGFATPQEVMTMWTTGDEMPDGPHRRNILQCNYTHAGVGLAYTQQYGRDRYPYWVLDLASRRK